jgi:hypothetical protein
MRDVAIAFRNRSASWIWGFAALWSTLLGAMTYVVARDGANGLLPANRDRYHGVLLGWRHRPRRIRASEAVHPCHGGARLSGLRDVALPSQGCSHFYARVRTAGSDFFDLAEGHTRALCESACDQFNRALQGQGKR